MDPSSIISYSQYTLDVVLLSIIYICCEEETSDMIESFTPDSDFMILPMSCLNVGLVTRSIVL